VLDGVTLRNLEITEGPKSLLSIMDKCSTQFGKRLLRHWICVPEANSENIAKRQDAVEELMNLEDLMDQLIPMMKSLLDLERFLGK
jgi:DNA mismatch repair protein MSH6